MKTTNLNLGIISPEFFEEEARREEAFGKRINFFVAGIPKPQPRPRAFARKFGNGQVIARVYDAKTAEGWKSQVAEAAKAHVPFPPLTGPLAVTLTFFFERPKSHYGSGRNSCVLKPDAPRFPIGRPDRDNLEKALTDSLTIIGMWKDDCQIVDGPVRKRYAEPNELSGCEVTIESL